MTDETTPTATPEPAPAPADVSFNDALAFAENVASRSEDVSHYAELRKAERAMERDPAAGRAQIQDTAKAMLSDPDLRRELTEERYRLQREQQAEQPAREEPRHEPQQQYDNAAHEDDAIERTKVITAFQVRADQARQRLPDFDNAMSTFQYAPLKAHVEQQILKSEMGPDIAYMIASNPGAFEIAEQLNSMPEAEAARWITKLETKVEMDRAAAAQQEHNARELAAQPQRRLQTRAQAPIRPPTGGAGPPVDLVALAKGSEDATQYVLERRRQERGSR